MRLEEMVRRIGNNLLCLTFRMRRRSEQEQPDFTRLRRGLGALTATCRLETNQRCSLPVLLTAVSGSSSRLWPDQTMTAARLS